ncbi:M56 family metallopeptidase [Aquimarina sp. AU474]|uniref:M56 family metallopeptidase n=1 Tax=Aquimarina sp. AU474 TaxID=2108529 RepID=UPI000D68F49C|nr:M56 family metallopeptidase [Aquimarina sp. AU474]
MIAYLIKSTLCLLVLGSFYKLFLEKEKVHNLKRYYLIFSILFAYTIPFITITYEKEVYINPQDIIAASEIIVTPTYVTKVHDITVESINYVPILLWSLYSIGFIIFGFRFTKNLYSLNKKVRKNEKLKESSHTNVLLRDAVVPYTFLKYIFVPKAEFLQKSIPEEVLFHEKAHVHQKHTLDILFVEVLQVVFWFNPLLFWLKKAIKLNHEFLADQTVLKHQFSIQRYVNLLVNYPTSSNQAALTSTINYSLTKKRLQMMTKEFSKKRVTLKLLAVVPTLLLCLLFFNNEIIAQEKNNWRYSKTNSSQDKEIEIRIKNEQIRVNGSSVTLDNLSNTIDTITQEWEDSELTGFNFDVKLQNVDQKFVDKINEVYRSTRLYKANPDGHDLVPPKPPMPPSPKVIKGEPSNIPPPAPKVRKGEKSTIPTPPKAPSYEESEREEMMEAIQEERETLAMEAMEQAEVAREEAEIMRERSQSAKQRANQLAREAVREQVEKTRIQAEEHAQIASLKAIEQSMLAHERTLEIQKRSAKNKKENRKELLEELKVAHKAAAEARKAAVKSQQKARRVQSEARKEAMKVQLEARKAAMMAQQEARKAAMVAQREAFRSKAYSRGEFIKKMDDKGAEFYYKGKRISSEEARRLINDATENLSINSKTKNGKTVVKIKN